MDRPLIYTQEQGRSTDFLFGMRSAMIGLAKLSAAVLGTSTIAHGLPCTPTSPASMQVNVGIGEIYFVTNVDGTPYGVLPADTTDQILKQGIQLAATTLSCPAPVTSGQSINYLIEATYQDSDTNASVLPYFNSNNPSQPLNGPGGLGGTNPTQRQGLVSLQAKAGTPATTGTQTTPSPDAGYVGLFVVTVAFGASSITSGNISQYSAAPFVSSILQMLQTGSGIYSVDTSGSANTITLALTPPVTSYSDGEPIRFKAANSNTGNTTINWGGGSITLTGMNGTLQGGEIIAGKQYEAIYSSLSGTAILLGQSGGALQIAPATQSGHAIQLGQATGRLLRTTIWAVNGGVQQISVNGGAFSSTGAATFTPLALTTTVIFEMVGGAGGSGGVAATSSTQNSVSSGGSGGAYAKGLFTSGFSGITITAGAPGTAGAAGANNGGSGGTSSAGVLISAPGGPGGLGGAATAFAAPFLVASGGPSSAPAGGNLLAYNGSPSAFAVSYTSAILYTSAGGSGPLGSTGPAPSTLGSKAASGYGTGPSGAYNFANGSAQAGLAGQSGVVIAYEYA